MSKLSYRTIANESSQGKPYVYFSCHPDDFDKFFEEYAAKILEIQDCAIWYEAEPEADYDREDLELNLSQMQLFVMPVTTKLLTEPCRAMEVELPLAKEKHIPVLPLMMEQGLDDVFSKHFGDLQYLDPNDRDETKRKFDEVLARYIESVLVSDELAEKVRAAFDAYIFLSYRKKDRRKAQELMRLIHRSPLCRDIAIWYDEFLTPGEDFNDAIGKMLEKSDLFALVVTPNLVNETNYVMTTEYPAAREQEKPILPVEMEETDRKDLEEHYPSIPPCVMGVENEIFRTALLEKIRTMAVEANDTDPEHNFLIGLAYLAGIDVEVDNERAVELITGAAEAGIPEAIQQLATMYETGTGVERDYYEGVRWRKRHVEFLRKAYEEEQTEERADELIGSLWDLGDAQFALGMLEAAKAAYYEMQILAARYAESTDDKYRRCLSISYYKLGDTVMAMGDCPSAKDYYEKSLAIFEELSDKKGMVESSMDLSLIYRKLGDITADMGNLPAAQTYYEKSLAIDEDLAEKAETILLRRGVASDYQRLGEIAAKMGNLAAAQVYLEKSLAIFEKLEEKTGTYESRRDLSVSYEILGRTAAVMGKLTAAKDYFEKGNAVAKELAEETGTVLSRRDLASSYANLGDIAAIMGKIAVAKDYYEKDHAIAKELAEETGTVLSRMDLATNYNNLGKTAAVMGNLAAAKQYYEKCNAIAMNLAENVELVWIRRMLFTSYEGLGVIAQAMGNLAAAKQYYEKCNAVAKELVKETGTVESRRMLATSYEGLGDTAALMGNQAAARHYFEKYIAIAKKLVKKYGTVKSRRMLATGYQRLADTAAEMKSFHEAKFYYEKSLAIFEKIAENIGMQQALRDLVIALIKMGEFYYRNSTRNLIVYFRITDEQMYKKSKEMVERAVELGKDSSDDILNELVKRAKYILKKYFKRRF